MNGTITNIQRFSTHDGPGIRTTVFFKGCGMRCFWCHNPETLSPYPQIMLHSNKCIGCGKCIEVCPANAHNIVDGKKIFLRELCRSCGKCVDICYADALEICGKIVTVGEVMNTIEEDCPFYKNSGGGVTFSGGEPLLQIDFLKSLLMECKKRKIHTAVDTAANVPWENFLTILDYTDLFLFDLKVFDSEKHIKATGAGTERILDNLKKLSDAGAAIFIRIPVIPGVNDSADEMRKIANFLETLSGIKQAELLPFHRYGENKYYSLGLDYPATGYAPPTKGTVENLADIFERNGLVVFTR